MPLIKNLKCGQQVAAIVLHFRLKFSSKLFSNICSSYPANQITFVSDLVWSKLINKLLEKFPCKSDLGFKLSTMSAKSY